MKLAIYQIMHVGSLLMLASFLFMAFANPDPSGRRKTLMWTGIFSLLMLVGGFGMLTWKVLTWVALLIGVATVYLKTSFE